jgi:dihydroxyacid dehydratase/phosphogluconate dehydratase
VNGRKLQADRIAGKVVISDGHTMGHAGMLHALVRREKRSIHLVMVIQALWKD